MKSKEMIDKNNKGITLIALVITIIVLLILASIGVYSGLDTVRSSKYMSFKTELQLLQSKVDEFYSSNREQFSSKGTEMTAEQKEIFTVSEVSNVLSSRQEDITTLQNGFKYYTADVLVNDFNIEGITIDYYINIDERIVIAPEPIEYNGVNYYMLEQIEDAGYNVDYNKNMEDVTFNASSSIIDGEKGLIQLSNIECKSYVEKWQIRYREKGSENWNITNEFIADRYDIDVDKITDYEVQVFHGDEIQSDIVTVSIGKPAKPEESELTEFAKNFGVIEIEFLEGTGYNVTNTPNEPILEEGMKAVYWDENGKEITEGDSNFDRSKWYNYAVQSSGTGNGGTSHWANAKVTVGGVDSYFVWIPRYAYRIVYFDTQQNEDTYRNKTTGDDYASIGLTGYSDARGIVDYNGKQIKNVAQDMAISVNEKYFKPHPAFENDVNYGGWSERLEGIWVAKYEASRIDASATSMGILTTPASIPNVQSWKQTSIREMYNYAMKYQENLRSHLMKNSEWGAVAYLTDSKYGRNGTEVTINNNSNYLTGNAGNSISEGASATTNAYNTQKGQLASTTGNIYGIYDLSGGAIEFVAGYHISKKNDDDSFTSGVNNSFSTVYEGDSINMNFKYGDATYETSGWNGDDSYFVKSNIPFFQRGGRYDITSKSGIFSSENNPGEAYSDLGFRICLVVQ